MSGVSWQWRRAPGEDTVHAFTRVGAIEGVALHESMCGHVPPRPWVLREAEAGADWCRECEATTGERPDGESYCAAAATLRLNIPSRAMPTTDDGTVTITGAPGGSRTWEEIRDGMISAAIHPPAMIGQGRVVDAAEWHLASAATPTPHERDAAPAWAVEILTEVRGLAERVARVERLLTTGTVRRPRTAATEDVDEAVLKAIRSGARSLTEIIAASGRRRQRVCEARDRLIAAGLVREVAGEQAGRGRVPRWFVPATPEDHAGQNSA